MEYSDRENKYFKAKERVAEIKKFYTGLMTYVLVIALLAGVNYWVDEWGYPWFLWAAFGWGLGLVFQFVKAFNLNPFFRRGWEERKIREFMDEDKNISRWK